MAALATIDAAPERCGFTVHGTTQGLNAFLQRRGERVLLLAGAGAGDVYHIARGNRTRLYDIHFRKPTPLVPRADIVEIGGRLDYAGDELAAPRSAGCGLTFNFLPVRRESLAHARVSGTAEAEQISVFAWEDGQAHARVFIPGYGQAASPVGAVLL